MTVVIVYVRKIQMVAGFSCRPKRIERAQLSGFETQRGGTHLVLPGLGQKLLCFFLWFRLWSLLVYRGRAQYIYIYTSYMSCIMCTFIAAHHINLAHALFMQEHTCVLCVPWVSVETNLPFGKPLEVKSWKWLK